MDFTEDDKLFAALDRMIEAGGQKLAKKVLVGDLAKKAADTLVTDLETHNYIHKDGKTFSVMIEGRRAWEERASEPRKREIADRPVAAFLEAVNTQNGKALSAAQKKTFREDIIRQVQAEGLVIEVGAKKYKLSPKGEAFLQARDLERLRTATQDSLKAPQAFLRHLAEGIEKLAEGRAIHSVFAEARAAIQTKLDQARADSERSLDGLKALVNLVAAEEVLHGAVTQALERIDAETERVRSLETELRHTAVKIQEELECARQQMEKSVAALEERARTTTVLTPTSVAPAEPSDEAILQATRRTYGHLEQQFKVTGELIKIPNLADGVRVEVPGLTATRFHDLLQRWQREDRLVLQVCNDPHFEPRSAEGIPSARGLLFYVEMK
jgi:hypothetical protein